MESLREAVLRLGSQEKAAGSRELRPKKDSTDAQALTLNRLNPKPYELCKRKITCSKGDAVLLSVTSHGLGFRVKGLGPRIFFRVLLRSLV